MSNFLWKEIKANNAIGNTMYAAVQAGMEWKVGTQLEFHFHQGCVLRQIHTIRRILFNAYFTVSNKSGRMTHSRFSHILLPA